MYDFILNKLTMTLWRPLLSYG